MWRKAWTKLYHAALQAGATREALEAYLNEERLTSAEAMQTEKGFDKLDIEQMVKMPPVVILADEPLEAAVARARRTKAAERQQSAPATGTRERPQDKKKQRPKRRFEQ